MGALALELATAPGRLGVEARSPLWGGPERGPPQPDEGRREAPSEGGGGEEDEEE